MFTSTPDDKISSNYLEIGQSYVILCATTQ